jgi:integrase
MTALSLKQVLAKALAEIGANLLDLRVPKGRPRTTTWIGVEHGFGVRHYKSGRNVYIVQTRMGGRVRTVTIGPANVITQHQAAAVARRVSAYAQVGGDPATDRRRARGAPRFDDFLEEYWRRWAPRWKPSTYDRNQYYRALYLDDSFTGVFIDELNEAHVTKWFSMVTDNGGPGAANRTLGILSHMLNKAESWGYRRDNTNPCREVRQNRRRKCERFLSVAELEKLGGLLARERAGDEKVRPVAAVAITLLLLTGCRCGEILGLQWQDVKGSRLKLRDSKTGPRTIWLGDEARALIATLPRHRNIPWLFWNLKFRKPLKNVQYYWEEFRSKVGLRDVRLHDLRHTFASHAAMNKESIPMIGRLLGHVKAESTSRYSHLGDEHLLEASEQIGIVVERLLGSTAL